ncbi:uncharacterized protein LOC134478169 [Cavia porcellus]|uniref:uncharacterized protein LOC134478169 n=1 Tax=Cavia porcellus TaxID=10141 RepID=UPI002FE07E38
MAGEGGRSGGHTESGRRGRPPAPPAVTIAPLHCGRRSPRAAADDDDDDRPNVPAPRRCQARRGAEPGHTHKEQREPAAPGSREDSNMASAAPPLPPAPPPSAFPSASATAQARSRASVGGALSGRLAGPDLPRNDSGQALVAPGSVAGTGGKRLLTPKVGHAEYGSPK